MTGAADQWRELVTNLENLSAYAKPDEMETARALLHDYIGEVSVVEEAGQVFACAKLSGAVRYKSGAQERH